MMSDAAATAPPRWSAATVPYGQRLLGIRRAEELPQNLFGQARASALAAVDRRYHCNGLIVADLSNDATYAEVLFETFGPRVIGLHISRFGDGMSHERRPGQGGSIPVYHIGRTYLLELLHSEIAGAIWSASSIRPEIAPRFEQLVNLRRNIARAAWSIAVRQGKHDDLGISCAMLAWAARHPHLELGFAISMRTATATVPTAKRSLGGLRPGFAITALAR